MAQFNLSLNDRELNHIIKIIEMNEFNDFDYDDDEWKIFITKLGSKLIKKYHSSGYTTQSVNSLELRIKEINEK
jgi:hypothetical protein